MLSRYLPTALLAIVSFSMGYFISDVQHTNSSSLAEPQAVPSVLSNTNTVTPQHPLSDLDDLDQNLKQRIDANLPLNPSEQEKLAQLITALPETKIDNYLSQAFPDQDLSNIADKKRFATRLVQEFSQNIDESNTLQGQVHFALTPTSTDYTQVNAIHKHQYIYAHFDTLGKVPANTQVFVKWINQDNNETLLFTPKYIKQDQHQNWVSVVPSEGWKTGRYSVKFYQMADSLTPIAQSSYTLTTVFE